MSNTIITLLRRQESSFVWFQRWFFYACVSRFKYSRSVKNRSSKKINSVRNIFFFFYRRMNLLNKFQVCCSKIQKIRKNQIITSGTIQLNRIKWNMAEKFILINSTSLPSSNFLTRTVHGQEISKSIKFGESLFYYLILDHSRYIP